MIYKPAMTSYDLFAQLDGVGLHSLWLSNTIMTAIELVEYIYIYIYLFIYLFIGQYKLS